TMLHAAGVSLDRALPELNLSRPALVRDLHAAYVSAGARILQTNTFGANRLRLAGPGLENSVSKINIAGARLAREAAQRAAHPVLVAGSIGPAVSAPAVRRVPACARADSLREQIAALCDWVDLLILETFGDLESLVQAVEVANSESHLPVVAQLTFGDDGRTLRGEDPAQAAAVLSDLPVAALGANCTVGPAVLVGVVAELARNTQLPVSVQPNAGAPQRLGGQLRYARNVAYFAEAAHRFVTAGATLLGGCCGTTPAHVRAISQAVAALPPIQRPRTAPRPAVAAGTRAVQQPAPAWPWEGELVIAVGLQAPNGAQVPEFLERATTLHAAGARVLAIVEAAPPAARISPVGAAVVVRERVGSEVLLPVEAADRNLAALQADLLGAHALGLRMVVCRTGSPRVAGDYPIGPGGTPWDVDSLGLIAMLGALNEGIDWRGVATAEHTRFVIGGTLHTSAGDLPH
ncbi:MAG: homocysteine S-methyltransferase family protein, partial [Actinomycetota bacterium]|nr:homocysteine S-methyltransferase family protein [Actinomycetota bacterium]